MPQPKLSIITINLNNRDGLRRTMESVVGQRWTDYEYIVVDGGSTDGSREIIEEYASHIDYHVSEPDSGIYNAMNKGIRAAKGEYALFLNSGDHLLSPTSLEEFFSYGYSDDILYGDIIIADKYPPQQNERRIQPENLSINIFYVDTVCHPCSSIRLELLKEEPYDEELRIVSDWKFFLRKAMQGCTFRHVPVVLTVFYEDGISSRLSDAVMEERQRVLEEELPPMLRQDLEELNRLREENRDTQMQALRAFRKESKLNHKMVTALLQFFRLRARLKHRRGGN